MNKETLLQTEKAELATFWAEIADNLPKSLERSALGDETIFTVFAIAYPKIRKHLVADTLKQAAEALEGMKRTDTDPLHSYMPTVYNGALTDAQKVLLGEDNR